MMTDASREILPLHFDNEIESIPKEIHVQKKIEESKSREDLYMDELKQFLIDE